MKRHFLTGLKAFAVSALALAAVSCYDDSELWGELESLEQRVAALEEKLNSEVATLNSKIGAVEAAYKTADADLLAKLTKVAADLDAADGKLDGVVTVEDLNAEIKKLEGKYEELKGVDTEILAALIQGSVSKIEKNKDGSAVITFLDGTTLEVSANTDNTGLVTVVDGKWAIVGADGKTTVLDALVHPDTELEFKVDPKTYEVFVTYDGKEWIATGVIVKDAQTINLVTGLVEAKDHVVITVGGVEYKLPKVSTNSFDIVSGMVFFAEGETKAIPVAMEGVVSSMVAKQPNGWTVTLTTDGGLEVTAPSGAGSDSGDDDYIDDIYPSVGPLDASVDVASEDYGMIELWVVTEDGKTYVGKLQVSLAGEFANITFSQDEEKGTIVKVSVPTYWDDWDEAYAPLYYPVLFGACPVDEFDGTALYDILKWYQVSEDEANYPNIFGVYDLMDMGGGYMHPMWLSEKEVALSDMLGDEAEIGETYVIWAFNTSAYEYDNNENAFIKTYYTPVEVNVDVPSVSWKDAMLDVTIKGVDDFYLGVIAEDEYEMLSYYWSDEAIDQFNMSGMSVNFYDMITGQSMFGTEVDAAGAFYKESYKKELSKIISEDELLEIRPGNKFYLCVLPVYSYKNKKDYSISDLYFYKSVNINELLYGGSSTLADLEISSINYDSFNVNVKSTSSEIVVYNFWTEDNYNDIVAGLNTADGETIQDYMIDNFGYNFVREDSAFEARCATDINGAGVEKGENYIFAAFAIDADGKCSALKTIPVTTKDYPYDIDNSISIAIDNVVFDPTDTKKVTVTYSLTGATKLAVYKSGGQMFVTNASGVGSLEESVVTGNNTYYRNIFTADQNGKVEVTYTNFDPRQYYNYKFTLFLAFNEDNAGTVTEVSKAQSVDISTYLVNDDKSFAAAVAEGGEVNLGANITLTEKLTIPAGKEVTINLRGNTLTFDNSGTAGYAILNYGKLTVSNGTILAKGTAFAAGLYNEGEATLNCNITSENSNAIKVDEGGKLTINGGKYEAKNPTGQALRVGNWQSGQASAWEVYINGGEFVGTWAGLYIVNNYAGLATAGKAEIKNATFQGSESVVDSGVKGSDIVFDNVKNVTIENCTLKTQSIHSETTGESVINNKTITTIENVYSTVFAAE